MNRRVAKFKGVVPLLALVALLVGATPLVFIACSNGGGSSPTSPELPVADASADFSAQPGQGQNNNNDAVCDGYDLKDDRERMKYTFPADSSDSIIISEICMKAGQKQFIATCDPDMMGDDRQGNFEDDCHIIEWSADCSMVTLERVGSGRYCQGMSHAAIAFEPGPSPSPSPSPTPAATPSPSSTP